MTEQLVIPPSATIVSCLDRWAVEQPDAPAFTFTDSVGNAIRTDGFAELRRQALAWARRLLAGGLQGERALLLFIEPADMVPAFLGCLYAGVVAVPVRVPSRPQGFARLGNIVEDCEPRAVMADARVSAFLQAADASHPLVDRLRAGLISLGPRIADEPWTGPSIDAETLAFLQYTSGSTGQPRGVMLRQRHLLANLAMIDRAFSIPPRACIVSWLPLFHDMGLIGTVLTTIYQGCSCVLMPANAFSQRPATWLEAVSRYRATISGGPNFAYEMCTRSVTDAELAGLDLSCWKTAFTGAEPVRVETMRAFSNRFASCGFSERALQPTYGLAEATLFVTAESSDGSARVLWVDRDRLAENEVVVAEPPTADGRSLDDSSTADRSSTRALVSCGQAAPGTDIQIVDIERSAPLESGKLGEIWVSGPSVASGYWNRHEDSAAVFAATLPALGQRPYLRTGDVGFIKDGGLYIAGRLKDIVIVGGRNLHATDIEEVVAKAHPLLEGHVAAAFGVVQGGAEKLVIVHEVTRATWRRLREEPGQAAVLGQLLASAESATLEELEIPLSELVIVAPGSIPRTTSGKVRRRETKGRFLAGELTDGENALVARPASEPGARSVDGVKRWLLGEIAREIGVPVTSVSEDASMFALGLSSLQITRIAVGLRHRLGADVASSRLFDHGNVRSLAESLASSVGATPAVPGIVSGARAADEPVRLSGAQERLWFLSQLPGASVAYNLCAAMELRGDLDREALGWVFGEIVRRHEILRSRFVNRDGLPYQLIQPWQPVPIAIEDLPDADAGEPASLEQRLAAEAGRPFDLADEPPLRLLLLRSNEQRHIFVVTLNHLAADGWSVGVLARELSHLYNQRVDGKSDAPSSLPIQYADYARWQRQQLEGPGHEDGARYWREKLAGAPPLLELPLDRPRPAIPRHCAGVVTTMLPAELVLRLRQFAQSRNASLYMVLAAAFSGLLRRYTGQGDIVLGCPVAGRLLPEVEPLVGFFVNTLALRLTARSEDPFDTVLAATRQTCVEAMQHQQFPFEALVDLVGGAHRNLSYSPVFQVMLTLENEPLLADLALQGLELGQTWRPVAGAKFDLAVSLQAAADGGLRAEFEYDADIFDASTISRWTHHFERLLQQVVESPAKPVCDLEILADDEQRLFAAVNATEVSFPESGWVHQMFERQAAAQPGAPAVTLDGASLNYAELDRRATILARHLRAWGVGRDVLVGVCMERSFELVISLLAILKAGGAYVPLDPEYPPARLSFMARDANASVLLVQRRFAGTLPDLATRLVAIDEMRWEDGQEQLSGTGAAVDGADAAYVIYTSGSTGQPKGVVNVHAGIRNQLLWRQGLLQIGPGDRVLQKTPISFDVSMFDLLSPLVAGAEMVLARPGGQRDAAYLWELLRTENITVVHFVPSALRQFLDAAPSDSGELALRHVVCSGEALPPQLAGECLSKLSARLHNLYGPTEAAIDVTAWECSATDADMPRVPIGRPIANVQIHILDQRQRRTPVGIPGEIYIGGTGLARGYHGQPAQTALRFVANPFDGGCSRLYRTGDAGRYLANGAIDFLGRLDTEVKLRGFRIELQEIERNLDGAPAVRECAVVKRCIAGEDGLVAYIALRDGAVLDPSALKARLGERLPSYMIPARFVAVSEWPLTPSNKLDRKALSERPLEAAASSAPAGVPAEGPREQMALQVYREVLGIEELGVTDNIFEFGAHSLLLMRVQARLAALGWQVPVTDLFQRPTVRELCAALSETPATTIKRANPTKHQPLSSALQQASREIDPITRAALGPLASARALWVLWEVGWLGDGKASSRITALEIRERLRQLATARKSLTEAAALPPGTPVCVEATVVELANAGPDFTIADGNGATGVVSGSAVRWIGAAAPAAGERITLLAFADAAGLRAARFPIVAHVHAAPKARGSRPVPNLQLQGGSRKLGS